MSNLTVVVAGIPALSEALQASGRFARVVSVGSTSDLKKLLQSGTLSSGVGDKIFMFADTTTVDTPQTLPFLMSRLVAMRAPVVVVATSPAARDLVAQCPGAGLLEGPLTLNLVIGALAGLPDIPPLQPVENNVAIALPGIDAVPAAPAAPALPPQFPAQDAGPAAPGFPGVPAAGPFDQPAQATFPPAPAPAAPAAAPAFPSPAVSPFGGPAAPSFDKAPVSPDAAPAPARRRSLGDVAAESATSPFGQPAQQPAPAQDFPAAPFGQPAQQPAPAQEFAASPFGQPAQDFGASPFGQPAQDFGASPFGQPAVEPSPRPFGQPAQDFATSPFGQPPTSGPSGWSVQEPSMPAAPALRAGVDAAPGRPPRRGHVITVTAPKGGTGKSTLSLNLAAYLGLRLRGTGKNVCLIDANVQQADTGKYLNAFTPNVEGVLKDVSAIHPDRINNYLLHKPELNCSFLLGPATPEAANPLYFSGKRYTQILEALKPNYDYILIDTPVAELYHDIFRDFALPQADFIATTIAPNVATLLNTDSWLRQVTAPRNADGMGVDREKIGIVLNRAQDDIGLSEEEVRRELGEWRFLGSIPETKEWQRCNNLNEIVATKNYHELNEAFSILLAAATGEELLSTTPAGLVTPRNGGGLSGLLGRVFGKKG